MRFVLWSPELNQTIRALCSEDPNWTKWFVLCVMKSRSEPNESRSALWSPELNQMNRALKPRTEPNESRSEVPNWTKWITLSILKSRTESNESRSAFWSLDWTKWFALWSPELNQINHTLTSHTLICVLKSRLNQMIRALHSEVPNWTKWIALCALKSRIEPNDSRSVLWSPELNQINRALCSEDPNLTKLMELCVLKTRTEPN